MKTTESGVVQERENRNLSANVASPKKLEPFLGSESGNTMTHNSDRESLTRNPFCYQ